MYKIRLLKVHKLLQQTGCTCCLFTDGIDVEYICGFRSSNAAVVITNSENVLFSDFRYKSAAENFLKRNRDWKFILVTGPISEALGKYFEPGNIVGFRSDSITVDFLSKLKKSKKMVSFKPLSEQIVNLFVEKAHFEIKSMKKAAQIADRCFAQLIEQINPEMTEREVARKLDIMCLDAGSEGAAFETIVLSGSKSALPHGRPGETRLSNKKFIVIDFGCKYKGFCSDMTRTIVFGKATERMKKIYDTVLYAQTEACSKAQAGMFTDELDKVARFIIEKKGFGNYFGHALGHGVGLRIHEHPRISSQCHEKLIEDSIITIEPGIYISGFGGVRIEDMVRITARGIEILSLTPKELIEL